MNLLIFRLDASKNRSGKDSILFRREVTITVKFTGYLYKKKGGEREEKLILFYTNRIQ